MYRFHHVALSVSDLARSVAFYELLGFTKVGGWQLEDGSLHTVDMKNEGMLLELFCHRDSQPLPLKSRELEGDIPVRGTKHFGLQVGSIQAAKRDLLSKNIPVAFDASEDKKTGASYVFVQDPDGILVEIIEDRRAY